MGYDIWAELESVRDSFLYFLACEKCHRPFLSGDSPERLRHPIVRRVLCRQRATPERLRREARAHHPKRIREHVGEQPGGARSRDVHSWRADAQSAATRDRSLGIVVAWKVEAPKDAHGAHGRGETLVRGGGEGSETLVSEEMRRILLGDVVS